MHHPNISKTCKPDLGEISNLNYMVLFMFYRVIFLVSIGA